MARSPLIDPKVVNELATAPRMGAHWTGRKFPNVGRHRGPVRTLLALALLTL